jgi:hypothetical protein
MIRSWTSLGRGESVIGSGSGASGRVLAMPWRGRCPVVEAVVEAFELAEGVQEMPGALFRGRPGGARRMVAHPARAAGGMLPVTS